jgi:hypothetical protein
MTKQELLNILRDDEVKAALTAIISPPMIVKVLDTKEATVTANALAHQELRRKMNRPHETLESPDSAIQ